jgi:hypothetical protein
MNALRRPAIGCALGLFAAILSGCAVPYGGYGYYDGGVDMGLDYYESDGGDYGGWEPGYYVGPFHGDGHRPGGGGHPHDGGGHPPEGGGQTHAPAYKPAPASHPAPSIPARSRSKGSRQH